MLDLYKAEFFLMRCLIHVGTHHTGTTSLQKILSDQSNYLKKIGIVYPESIKKGFQHSLLPGAYFPKHNALPENRSLDIDFYIEKLKEEIDPLNSKLCLISSEVFTELIRQKKSSLYELFNKLETIFDDISIMYTSRDDRERSFSAQKAQIRLSSSNHKFRSDIFNAPERFRNKVIATEIAIREWEKFKKEIIVLNMEDSEMPILMYINSIISQLDLDDLSYQKHSRYFKEIFLSGNYILNIDPHKPISYLLLILIGIKIKNEERNLKESLTIDLINKFIDECDQNYKRFLFIVTKSHVISFLENYKFSIFKKSEVLDVLKDSGLTFSSRVIMMKVIDDFIIKLILDC